MPCLVPEGSKIRSRSRIGACVGSLESPSSLDSEYAKTLPADLMGRSQNAFKRKVVAFAIVNVRRRHPGNPIVSLSFLISSVQKCMGGGSTLLFFGGRFRGEAGGPQPSFFAFLDSRDQELSNEPTHVSFRLRKQIFDPSGLSDTRICTSWVLTLADALLKPRTFVYTAHFSKSLGAPVRYLFDSKMY